MTPKFWVYNSISVKLLSLLALYSKSKGQYLHLALPLHALFLHQPLPDNIPQIIPENVQLDAINVVNLCIQHTGALAGQNVHSDQGIVEESVLTMTLEVMPPKTDDDKLQLQVMTFPGQVSHVEMQTMQTSDCADSVIFFYLYLNFLVNVLLYFPASSHYVHCASLSNAV